MRPNLGTLASIVLCGVTGAYGASIDRFARLPLAFEPSATGGFMARSGRLSMRISAAGAMIGTEGMRLALPRCISGD